MHLPIEKYTDAAARWPAEGQHILAHRHEEQIVVYQAYNRHIADHAVAHQSFGGSNYSYSRMSWIKPNFLWMMYRCGWAAKDANQERVLAIHIDRSDFEAILQQAVFSSFDAAYYASHDTWKKELEEKDVRLQWDPDHDPYGNKLKRRAIQVGMKGRTLEAFGKEQIKRIEDITDFVKEQKAHVDNRDLDRLLVPVETVYTIHNKSINIGVD